MKDIKQIEEPFSSVTFKNHTPNKISDVRKYGCGVCCFSSIIANCKQLDYLQTLKNVVKYATDENGDLTYNFSFFNLKFKRFNKNELPKKIITPLVVHLKDLKKPDIQHFILVVGFDTVNYKVLDPASYKNKTINDVINNTASYKNMQVVKYFEIDLGVNFLDKTKTKFNINNKQKELETLVIDGSLFNQGFDNIAIKDASGNITNFTKLKTVFENEKNLKYENGVVNVSY